MPHIAVKVNMLIDIDVEPVSDYRRVKVILCHVKLQIWSRELTTPTLWISVLIQRYNAILLHESFTEENRPRFFVSA